jgi:hypothetical protein
MAPGRIAWFEKIPRACDIESIMRNFLTALLGGIGMALLVGGISALFGAIFQQGNRVINHLGPFNGIWEPDQVRFLGAILAAFGSGIFTFAMLARRKG